MLEFRVAAASEAFSGAAVCYVALDEAKQFAEHISGFPVSTSDVREYQLGSPGGIGMGGGHLVFKCADGSGHLIVEVQIWAERLPGGAQSASVFLNTVPACIDSFVAELLAMGTKEGARASLLNAT